MLEFQYGSPLAVSPTGMAAIWASNCTPRVRAGEGGNDDTSEFRAKHSRRSRVPRDNRASPSSGTSEPIAVVRAAHKSSSPTAT